ncbi:ribbon-helix-helix protein, CopG family [Chloroflexota bacterium]
MSIVIRVLYENEQWKRRCTSPFTDPLCWKCQEARRDLDQGKTPKLNITPPNIGDKECSGYCWERDLCNSFDWGSDQHFRRVLPGMKVFLVFEQKNDKSNRIEYRLWGRTIVNSVNVPPARKLEHDEEKYKYWIRLEPFEPLPRGKWSQPLSDKDLIGTKWGQGFYRYIHEEVREAFLEKLALGVPVEEAGGKLTAAPSTGKTKYGLLAPNIEQKVEEIAINQGRTREEIIRQAVAEWLKKQE